VRRGGYVEDGAILSYYGTNTWAPLLLALGVVGALSLLFFWPLSILCAIALVLVANFFRDPERTPEGGEEAVVSPADGRVVEIARVEEGEHVGGEALKIAIFMNLFDVHVNRMPCAGRVEWVRRVPGRFLNAVRAAASLENERTLVALRDGLNRRVLVKLIAGLIARRVVCPLRGGERLARGQRLGMIKFGSRVEVFLPGDEAFDVRVRVGQAVAAGRTILGEWR